MTATQPVGRDDPATWADVLAEARVVLGGPIEARRIVERASGYGAGELIAHLGDRVPARAVAFARAMVARRAAGEPLQYVVGRWGFRRLDLLVDRRVLIPRPETEVVTEVALAELRRLGRPRATVVDLGTGSGAIALSVAAEVRGVDVWGTDVSADALAVARANLAGLGSAAATQVRLAEGRWFEALPADLQGRVDLIVSNPPYVAAAEPLPAEVADWEPAAALVSGPTGLEAIEEVVAGAPRWLARPGALVMEIASHRAQQATALAQARGFVSVEMRPDLRGLPRALIARV